MNDVVALTDAEIDDAGALVAARHRRERLRFPLLPSAYEEPATCAELVRETRAFCRGVATFDCGTLAGFLTAFESAPAPTSPMARYAPERAALHLVHGHATATTVDPLPTYAALFSELASHALDDGITDHVVHVPIGDSTIEAAWVALGFGRVNVVAVRDLAPIDRPIPTDVWVRAATLDEIDIVDRLVDEESVFHAGSPIFRPYRRSETADAVRAQLAGELVSEDHAFLIARCDGCDVGVISVGPGLGSPLYVPDGGAYIAATAVLADRRGSGVGAALTQSALAWAKERGHLAACLHFATANAVSTSFWTGVGFTPVMAHLRRRLDERILHNRPGTAG